jgi:general secretion pathway protein J
MTNACRGQAGFTLVEVILALFIGALVMLGSYSVTSQLMALSEDVRTGLAAEDALDIVRLALGNDLGSVIWVEAQQGSIAESMAFYGGQQTMELSGQADRVLLSLATAASFDPAAPFPSHALNRVEYILRQPAEQDKAQPAGLRLVRRELPVATLTWRGQESIPVRETVLLETVTACDIRFYDNTAAQPAWDSRERQKQRLAALPTQVRLEGKAAFSGKMRSLDVRVLLPPQSYSVGDAR